MTPSDVVANSQAIENHVMSWGQSLTTEYNARDVVQIKDILAYRGLESSYASQLDGGNSLVTAAGADFIPFFSVGKTSQHQLSNELDVTAKTNYIDITAGQLYFEEQYHYPNGYNALAAAPGGVLPAGGAANVNDGTNVSIAEFAQLTGHLRDDLDVVAGLRYTRDDKEARYPVRPAESAEYTHQRMDWLAGVNYRPLDNLLVYGKASSGYISGGSYDGVAFGPETITEFEIGEKADLFDRRLRFNVAGFWSDYRHFQASSFSPADCGRPPNCIVNAGAERIWGGEAELSAIPVERLLLTANLGLTRYSLDPNQNPGAIPTNVAPKWSLGLSGQYDFPEFRGMAPSFRLEANYTSLVNWGNTTFSAPGVPPFFVTPALWIVNARATLAEIPLGQSEAKISLWGKNIFDKRYFSAYLTGAVIGFVDGNVSPPATYGVDFSIKY